MVFIVSLKGRDFVKCFILVKVSEETSDGIRSATKWMIDATITTPDPDDFNIDELFDAALEHMAAEKEVTVDYYMEEFLI